MCMMIKIKLKKYLNIVKQNLFYRIKDTDFLMNLCLVIGIEPNFNQFEQKSNCLLKGGERK
ncbi:hypothetical protein BpHYR1_013505 [Brachionus plicatilis]|uniref:Uncharacterized protein n=1 Tax=Brachionus plicatilis TaxID=10195 RepID=A0A3M7P1B5_BRAPC|nr:hypothetical protein BpHYR1_013505 [Brachionus plicatilis]